MGPTGPGEVAGGFRLVPGRTLRLRWLGTRVAYRDAHALQRALWAAGPAADDWLLLLEHTHVYTAGVRAKPEHMLADPASLGAELLWVDRGGDITYHGPGQLVGYPVLSVPSGPGATPGYVHEVEQLVTEAVRSLGLEDVGTLQGYPGVWVSPESAGPRKLCAIGARHSRRRTMHGFALNVDPDLAMFGHIVPCGITGLAVTSLAAEGVRATMHEVAEAVFACAVRRWGAGRATERQDVGVAGRPVRLTGTLARVAEVGAAGLPLGSQKPPWLRAKAQMGAEFGALRKTVRGLSLVTVCEEAGCRTSSSAGPRARRPS